MFTHCHFSIHTYKLCLSVSLFVYFHRINVKTAEPLELNIFEATYMTLGKVYVRSKFKKMLVKNVEMKWVFNGTFINLYYFWEIFILLNFHNTEFWIKLVFELYNIIKLTTCCLYRWSAPANSEFQQFELFEWQKEYMV